MDNSQMIDIEKTVERTIYRAALALDSNDWPGWLELCDDTFNYEITSFSPEINKDMTYFGGDKKELTGLMEMLPKHNTDHSPLHRHTTVYTVEVSANGEAAKAISSVAIYQNMLDGINSHLDSGESRLFVIGKYFDEFVIKNGVPKFTSRETKIENRRLDKGSHWPL
jgi:methanesulfonate monooxygenase small subunit